MIPSANRAIHEGPNSALLELLVLAVTEVEEHAQAATRADGRGPRLPGGARRPRPGYVRPGEAGRRHRTFVWADDTAYQPRTLAGLLHRQHPSTAV